VQADASRPGRYGDSSYQEASEANLTPGGLRRPHTVAMPDESGRSNTQAVVVVVAVVGLLATVSSAALGGYWANKNVERQFESQRSAKIQDQRREVYVDYLRAVSNECAFLNKGVEDKDALDKVLFEVLNQAGRVRLIAGPALKDAVGKSTTRLVFEWDQPTSPCAGNPNLRRFLDEFADAAEPDLE
jgi:hypothetical protein